MLLDHCFVKGIGRIIHFYDERPPIDKIVFTLQVSN